MDRTSKNRDVSPFSFRGKRALMGDGDLCPGRSLTHSPALGGNGACSLVLARALLGLRVSTPVSQAGGISSVSNGVRVRLNVLRRLNPARTRERNAGRPEYRQSERIPTEITPSHAARRAARRVGFFGGRTRPDSRLGPRE